MRKKKKTTSGNETISIFFNNFAGELVEIMTNRMSTVTTQTEEGTETGEYPWAITGFLLDEDDEFYYIGVSPEAVTTAVKKDIVIAVAVRDMNELKVPESYKIDTGDLN